MEVFCRYHFKFEQYACVNYCGINLDLYFILYILQEFSKVKDSEFQLRFCYAYIMEYCIYHNLVFCIKAYVVFEV